MPAAPASRTRLKCQCDLEGMRTSGLTPTKLQANVSCETCCMVREECSMSMNMPSILAILAIMATSLPIKNLQDMTEETWPAMMRSRKGLESLITEASPMMTVL